MDWLFRRDFHGARDVLRLFDFDVVFTLDNRKAPRRNQPLGRAKPGFHRHVPDQARYLQGGFVPLTGCSRAIPVDKVRLNKTPRGRLTLKSAFATYSVTSDIITLQAVLIPQRLCRP